MYKITSKYLDSPATVIYDPSTGARLVKQPKLTRELNQPGSLDFVLVHGHAAFENLESFKDYVTVEKDGEEIFYGRVLDIEPSVLTGEETVTCEGAMSFLNDGGLTPDPRSNGSYAHQTMTAEAFFNRVIDAYNAEIDNDPRRVFTVGIVDHSKKDDEQQYQITNYTSAKEAIEQYLLNNYGGFIRIRSDGEGGHLIDWIESYGIEDNSVVELAENIITQTNRMSGEDMFTAIRPIGQDGLVLSQTPVIDVYSQEEMEEYGRIVKSVEFPGITTEAALLEAGEAFAQRISKTLYISSEIGLLDLHFVYDEIPAIEPGEIFTNIVGLEGMGLIVSAMTNDIENPQNDSISLKNEKHFESDGLNEFKNNGDTLSKRSARGSGGVGMALKYYHELDNEAKINTDRINIAANKLLELHADQLIAAGNNLETLSRLSQDNEGAIREILGSAVIQHGTSIAQVAGQFELETIPATSDTPEWTKVKLIQGAQLAVESNGVYSEVIGSDQIHSFVAQTASQIYSAITDASNGLYSYVEQTASGTRQLLIETTNRTWIQEYDPTTEDGGSHTPKNGDKWIQSTSQTYWDLAEENDWNYDENFEWREIQGCRVWGWKNGRWELIVDQQDLITYGDLINTSEHFFSEKIAGIINEDGQMEVYRSLIEQKADSIRLEVHSATSQIYSSIQQTASNIRSEVGDAVQSVFSVIEQTADSIRADVSAADNAIYSSIEQTASSIKTDIEDAVSGLRTTITQTADSIRADVSAADNAIYSSIEQTASSIKSEIGDTISGFRSSIMQTIDEIRSDVSAADNAIYSAIEQTASSIKSEVEDALSGLRTTITQTADSIRADVLDADNAIYSTIEQTADSIRSDISAADNAIYTAIEQTASSIKSEVGNTIDGLRTTITQTENSIRADVSAADNAIYSAIEQTASSIKSELANDFEDVYSAIEQTANSIRADVSAADNTIYTAIEQTASAIKSEVNDVISDVRTTISQTADSIRSDVSAADNAIYSALEQTASSIRSSLADTEQGLYNYIQDTASGTRQIITNTTNRTWIQIEDPTTQAGGGHTPKDGDKWIASTHQTYWDSAEEFDWEHNEDFDWLDVQGCKIYGWTGGHWELVVDQQETITYGDMINTAEHYFNEKISGIINEQGQMDVYRSLIEQTATAIRAEVSAAGSRIYSSIEQTASNIRIQVAEKPRTVRSDTEPTSIDNRPLKNDDIWVKTTNHDNWDAAFANAWNEESGVNWNALRSDSIYMYKDGNWVEIVDGTKLVYDTDLDIDRNAINMYARKLERVNGQLEAYYSELKLDAHRIRTLITERYNDVGSSIEQTAREIRAEVHASQSQVYSSISIRADEIRSEVTDRINGLSSSITQNADKIALVVSNNNTLKVASIVAAINNQTGDSIVKLHADRIELDGATVAQSLLGQSIGANFVGCDTFQADARIMVLNATKIGLQSSANEYAVKNMVVNVEKSSDGKTLTLTKMDGSSVNFSKPSSSPPSISNSGTGIWTSPSIPSGAQPLSRLVTVFRRAEDDGDNLIIQVNNPGGSPVLYYCTP